MMNKPLETMTLTQLKARVRKNEPIFATLLYRFGKTGDDISASLRGERRFLRAKSYGFDLSANTPSGESELRVDRANLFDLTDGVMTIYGSGLRPLNEGEQAKLDAWHEVEKTKEYQERSRVDALTDGNSTYWQMVRFFGDEYSYLRGGEPVRGKSLVYPSSKNDVPMIRDKNVRGDVILQYRVYTKIQNKEETIMDEKKFAVALEMPLEDNPTVAQIHFLVHFMGDDQKVVTKRLDTDASTVICFIPAELLEDPDTEDQFNNELWQLVLDENKMKEAHDMRPAEMKFCASVIGAIYTVACAGVPVYLFR